MPAPLDMVTGAFSYTGRYIAAVLLGRGHAVRTLTGHPDRPDPFEGRVAATPWHFDDPAALAADLEGVDTLYNTYWIRFARGRTDHEQAVAHSRALIAAAEAAGVRRFVHISITGADPRSPLPYFRGKGLVEQALQASALQALIVRPALIFGPEDVLVHNLAWLLRHSPVLPVFGDGRYAVRPVFVEDLAALATGDAPQRVGTIDALGPETYTYRDLVRRIAAALGRRAAIVGCPPRLAWALAAALGLVVGDVVVTRDEIRGLMAGLLAPEGPSTAPTALGPWLDAQAPTLGLHYASEVQRHFRQSPAHGPRPGP